MWLMVPVEAEMLSLLRACEGVESLATVRASLRDRTPLPPEDVEGRVERGVGDWSSAGLLGDESGSSRTALREGLDVADATAVEGEGSVSPPASGPFERREAGRAEAARSMGELGSCSSVEVEEDPRAALASSSARSSALNSVPRKRNEEDVGRTFEEDGRDPAAAAGLEESGRAGEEVLGRRRSLSLS